MAFPRGSYDKIIRWFEAEDLPLPEDFIERAEIHHDLILSWSKRMNIVSKKDLGSLLERHILDSIVPAHEIPDKGYLVDIGSGAGLNIASSAYSQGMKVALLDDGPLGGTCLNRGCIPTKIILYPAEVVETLRNAGKIGVTASDVKVDFQLIMKRMHDLVDGDVSEMMEGIKAAKGLDFYNSPGKFVSDKVVEVEGKKITAPMILIAAGSREFIPPIPGLA